MFSPTLRRFGALLAASAMLAALAACGGSSTNDDDSEADRADDPQPTANAQMQAVLDKLAALGAQPIQTLTVEQARTQPTPADAVRAVLTDRGQSTAPEPVASVVDTSFPGPAGPVAIRIYTPAGAGPFPVIFYIHGGGWVIATIDTYDSSARALANAAGAIVVSTEYRKGPENLFPAAHDDTYAGYQWTIANAASFNGSPGRVAVVGESAGGNMAASIAIRARDEGIQAPVHQVLVYPVTDNDIGSPSEQQNANAAPLGTPALSWFFERYVPTAVAGENLLFSVLGADLRRLPPATVITADIDPLRSEGRFYAERLDDAGVDVDYENYSGVTHEFFGMGAVLDQADAAVAQAARRLRAAFGTSP